MIVRTVFVLEVEEHVLLYFPSLAIRAKKVAEVGSAGPTRASARSGDRLSRSFLPSCPANSRTTSRCIIFDISNVKPIIVFSVPAPCVAPWHHPVLCSSVPDKRMLRHVVLSPLQMCSPRLLRMRCLLSSVLAHHRYCDSSPVA